MLRFVCGKWHGMHMSGAAGVQVTAGRNLEYAARSFVTHISPMQMSHRFSDVPSAQALK